MRDTAIDAGACFGYGYENYGNANNRFGNIIDGDLQHNMTSRDGTSTKKKKKKGSTNKQNNRLNPSSLSSLSSKQQRRHELAYVLTVDEHIYRGIVREMGDAYRLPCGMYYCFHVTDDGAHVGIGVAVVILLIIFVMIVIGIIVWPTW